MNEETDGSVLDVATVLHEHLDRAIRQEGLSLHGLAIVRMADGRLAAMVIRPDSGSIPVLGALGVGLAADEARELVQRVGDAPSWTIERDGAERGAVAFVRGALIAFSEVTRLPAVWAVMGRDDVVLVVSTLPLPMALHALSQVGTEKPMVASRDSLVAVELNHGSAVAHSQGSSGDFDA